METLFLSPLRHQLSERRERLKEAVKQIQDPSNYIKLLRQVDSALEKMDNGMYGICEVCGEDLNPNQLMSYPLISVCLNELNEDQKRAIELDLQFASQIQHNLLPENNFTADGWEYSYHYSPAGPVSGDFCDLIKLPDNSLLFTLGDVSGKGVAASLMMSHLHALIRSLLSFGLSVSEMVEKANRLFCESTMYTNYATMVFGKANTSGEIEICVAGHNPPLLLLKGKTIPVKATGIPVGLFGDTNYTINKYSLQKNDMLLLYTDGLTESISGGIEYGEERVEKILKGNINLPAEQLVDAFVNDQKSYIQNSAPADDLTIMAIKRR